MNVQYTDLFYDIMCFNKLIIWYNYVLYVIYNKHVVSYKSYLWN